MTIKLLTVACFMVSFFAHSNMQTYDEFLNTFKEPDCSNIMDFVTETLELSSSNHGLLVVAAERFPTQVKADNEDPQKTPDQELLQDINNALFYIGENESILFDRATIIKQVLPTCLKDLK